LIKKLKAVLGIKGVLCLTLLITIGLALVTYTSTLSITPTQQFTLGATTASWTIYINDVDQVRYMPGSGTPAGSQVPVGAPSDGDTNTFAFKVVTDAGKVSAVKIELTSTVNSSEFSKFQITTKWWNSSAAAWQDATLYVASTGSTTKSYIDGLNATDVGYIHHAALTSTFYLIMVTYSYDLVDTTTVETVTFQYTPLPQDSF